jgi:hypothetical protein
MNIQTNVRKFEEAIITASWRRTGMGAVTHPIGLKMSGNRLTLVRPMREEYSRSGNHGRWFYSRENVDILLYLEQSNSGKRSVILSICRLPPEVCNRVGDVAETLWVGMGASTKDVEKALTLLQF